MSLDWRGQQVFKTMLAATKRGIDVTMSKAVIDAKRNHPGWNNVTGAAEGSVRVVDFAKQRGRRTFGTWGSTGVSYVITLELKRGSFLRGSGDRNHPKLAAAIRAAFNG